MPVDGHLRIEAVGDLHCPRLGTDELRTLFARIAERSDVLLLCGDITDYGKSEEAERFVAALPALNERFQEEQDRWPGTHTSAENAAPRDGDSALSESAG